MQKVLFPVVLLLLFLFSSCGGRHYIDETEPDEECNIMIDDKFVLVNLTESPEAFPNPMKGFRPGIGHGSNYFGQHEFARVYRQYVRYTNLELSSTDTVQKIIDWGNAAWAGMENRNIKVIPRVVLTYPTTNQPGASADNFWPDDIPQPSLTERWITDELKQRLDNFIMKLGEAWDNDPRVAAIELGLWGHWGEHHIYPSDYYLPTGNRIPLDMQEVLGDSALLAFKNKKVMVRYPETFQNYEVGFYWDSFALPEDSDGGEGMITRGLWQTQMISGEVAYDWGDQSLLGGNPNATLRNDNAVDYLIDWIRRINASSLGWIADYDQNDNALAHNAARIQKALGYRFVINSAVYNKKINPGDELSIELEISNTGSAPFYYQWPVELSLLNQQRSVVWSGNLDADIRSWLPDETVTVNWKTAIPSTIESGSYILAISILDPSGNLPSLRFANINYFNRGRTPLGIIGFGQEPEYYTLEPFDSLKEDQSIMYSLN